MKFALIAKVFGTERHTHHHYHGGRREASIRKRSRKQCRISHHQDMKCFYFVSSAASRGLVLRAGLASSVNFSQYSLFWLKILVFTVMLFSKRLFSILSKFSSSPKLLLHLNGLQVFISVCLLIMLPDMTVYFWQNNISRDQHSFTFCMMATQN